MLYEEKTVKEEIIFEGRVVKVQRDEIELFDGSKSFREVVKHTGGVCIAAIEGDEIYLVKQFRYPNKEFILEVPAGKLEKDEDPFEAAKREQREETGTLGENYVDLGKMYPTPGYCSEIIYMWACRVSEKCDMDLDEGEFVEVIKIKISEAVRMVFDGEICDAKTQIAILKANELVGKGII